MTESVDELLAHALRLAGLALTPTDRRLLALGLETALRLEGWVKPVESTGVDR